MLMTPKRRFKLIQLRPWSSGCMKILFFRSNAVSILPPESLLPLAASLATSLRKHMQPGMQKKMSSITRLCIRAATVGQLTQKSHGHIMGPENAPPQSVGEATCDLFGLRHGCPSSGRAFPWDPHVFKTCLDLLLQPFCVVLWPIKALSVQHKKSDDSCQYLKRQQLLQGHSTPHLPGRPGRNSLRFLGFRRA